VYLKDMAVDDDFKFSDDVVNIRVKACRIVLRTDPDLDEVNVYVNARKELSFLNQTETGTDYFDHSDGELKMFNPFDTEDACDIEISANVFPTLNITCEDRVCPIT
jgi:hypothetical protein